MKRILKAPMCLAAMMITGCIGNVKKSETMTSDTLLQDSSRIEGARAIGTEEPNKSVNIYKVWISEDSTWLFDLRDDTHYVEARMYSEEDCKENPDYKPGVYYIETEAGGFEVGHDYEEQGDSIGDIKYLLEQGPYAGTYALRFSFYNMTPTSATFLFEGEYEWTFTVLDKPVELLENPHPYVYEE